MRKSVRFVVAGFVSAVALAVVPVAAAAGIQVAPDHVYCCR
jgi:hypothetical protein